MPTLKARGSDGVVCIFDGAEDVVDDPLLDLSRVYFHSNLLYPKIVNKVSGSITLPAIGTNTERLALYILFSHGLSPNQPIVFGYLTGLSVDKVSMDGSVPVQTNINGFAQWVILGADSTNVLLHENTITHQLAGFNAITLNYVVYITDTFL